MGFSQFNEKVEVYEKEAIKNKKPVPYVFIREGDVMWSKTIWRMIDLRHKENMPLYYPLEPIGNRMSLIDLLLYGIKNEGVNAYDANSSEAKTEFDVLLTKEQLDIAMDALPDTVKVADEAGVETTTVTEGRAKTEEVKQFLIKEKWYFDKQHSVMNVRIIGLCPVRLYTKDDNPSLLKKQVMWIYYPEVRALLTNHEIYNRYNEAQRISFDDYLMQRRFTGFVWAESNVYDDRWINEYTAGIQTLLEAERIDNELFRLEHDMWVY